MNVSLITAPLITTSVHLQFLQEDLRKKCVHSMQHWSWSLPFVLLGRTSRCIYTITTTKCGSTHSSVYVTQHLHLLWQRHDYPFQFNLRPFISRYIIFADVTPTRRQQLVLTVVIRTAEVCSASYNNYIATLLGVGTFVASCALYHAGAIARRPGSTPLCTWVATVTFRCVC
jgi:hypothetical protein